MSRREYKGPALDGTYQSISEAPHWQGDGETVDVVDDTPVGRERTENVPVPNSDPDPPEREGQTTLEEWSR